MIMAPRSKNSQKLKALTQNHHAALPNTARATLKKNSDEHVNTGAITERHATDRKTKVRTSTIFRELSLSTSAQKIQSSIENVSNAGACDTSRTAQVQRKEATIE